MGSNPTPATKNMEVVNVTGSKYVLPARLRQVNIRASVSRLMPLKGFLRDEDYKELVRLAKLNHFDQIGLWGNDKPEEISQFNEAHKKEITKIKEPDEFLTEIFWKLI